MDLETENRLAALLMEEARRLRVQADKEGVHVYLQQPNVRGRPNSRFLTATVLGVQQANRAVEVGEMWRARDKELELEAKLKSRVEDKNICRVQKHHGDSLRIGSSLRRGEACRDSGIYSSSSKHDHKDCYTGDDDGLRDEEVEQFLHSRAKRGRGAIGSRMDEPGPYISSTSSGQQLMTSPDARMKEEWESRILGPEKPSFLKSHEPPEEAHDQPPEDVHDPKVRFTESSKRKHRSKERRSERKKSVKTKSKERSSSKHRHKRRRRD